MYANHIVINDCISSVAMQAVKHSCRGILISAMPCIHSGNSHGLYMHTTHVHMVDMDRAEPSWEAPDCTVHITQHAIAPKHSMRFVENYIFDKTRHYREWKVNEYCINSKLWTIFMQWTRSCVWPSQATNDAACTIVVRMRHRIAERVRATRYYCHR